MQCHPHILKTPKMRTNNPLRQQVLVEAGCRVCLQEIQQLDPAHLVMFVDGRRMEAQVLSF